MLIDLKNILVGIAAIIILGLGLFVLLNNKKNKINLYFSFLTYCVVLWCVAMIGYRSANTVELSLIWSRILYLSAIFIPLALLYFSYLFLQRSSFTEPTIQLPIILPSITIMVLSVLPNVLIKNVIFHPGREKEIVFNLIPYIFYFLYIVFYFSWVYVVLIKNYLKSSGLLKVQISYILAGTLSSGILGMTTNLVLPTLHIFTFNWLGQILTIVFVSSIAYAISKHHLFNIKVIATEIFSVLITAILLVDALLAKTWAEFFLKFGLFVGVAIFSVLLIRGVLNEVKARDKMAKMAKSLEKANIELRKLDKTKSEFISIASHQVRTPLSVIKGFLSMILEGFYGPVSAKILDKIKKAFQNAERLIRLIDDLLNLSRMEQGRMSFEFQKTSLREIIEGVFNEMTPQAKDKGLQFIYQGPKEDHFYINGDAGKLRQVIENLIDNAIKYTSKGKIEISLERIENQAVISIKDTGIGFKPEEKRHLFEKFVRGEKVPRLWTEGVGLGLYVAKLIIDEHHGQIGAESPGQGKGSRFWIKLPLM